MKTQTFQARQGMESLQEVFGPGYEAYGRCLYIILVLTCFKSWNYQQTLLSLHLAQHKVATAMITPYKIKLGQACRSRRFDTNSPHVVHVQPLVHVHDQQY